MPTKKILSKQDVHHPSFPSQAKKEGPKHKKERKSSLENKDGLTKARGNTWLGLKLSISSQIICNLVKNSITMDSSCFMVETSDCKSEMHMKPPWKYLDFKSFQIVVALSIHNTLCRIEWDTEWTIQEVTISLQRFHAWYKASFFSGSVVVPSTNWILLLARHHGSTPWMIIVFIKH